eukprot:2580318-Alexandrium_andersonii.AAC.1
MGMPAPRCSKAACERTSQSTGVGNGTAGNVWHMQQQVTVMRLRPARARLSCLRRPIAAGRALMLQ